MKKLGILGLGWFGIDLAHHLKNECEIIGTKRNIEDIEASNLKGIEAIPLDLNKELSSETERAIFNVDTLVLNVPPGIRNNENQLPYSEMMLKVLSAINRFELGHLIFVSSTGVFGMNQLIVNEETLPKPNSESGKILFEAESLFSRSFKGRTTILRPAGLVGKGRHPAKYLAGRKGISGPNHPVNLVHIDDLIRITEYLIGKGSKARIVHAVTNHHPSKKEYYTKAAFSLNLEPPQFDDGDESEGRRVDSVFHDNSDFPSYTHKNLFDMV